MNLCIECGKVTMVGDTCMDCIGKEKGNEKPEEEESDD